VNIHAKPVAGTAAKSGKPAPVATPAKPQAGKPVAAKPAPGKLVAGKATPVTKPVAATTKKPPAKPQTASVATPRKNDGG
jgi:hypothetical protein